MKKWSVMMALILSAVLMIGCGKERTEESQEGSKEESQVETDASGDAIVINDIPRGNGRNESGKFYGAGSGTGTGAACQRNWWLTRRNCRSRRLRSRKSRKSSLKCRHKTGCRLFFLGDSILDGYRNETGIAYLTGVYCDADVYNLAMGGTTAALSTYESAVYEEWNSRCLQGVVHAICGNIDSEILNGYQAGEVFPTCDFSNTDYFVIEYGMNDFLSGVPLSDEDDTFDEYTYAGALRIAIQQLRGNFPDATIVLCSPNYAQFWGKDGSYLGDGNMVNNGGGALVEYHRVCGNVSADMNTLFLNGYEGIGLDAYTADEYLEDGIHLAKKAAESMRRSYHKLYWSMRLQRTIKGKKLYFL